MDIKRKIHNILYSFSINLVGKYAINLYMSKIKIKMLHTNTRIPIAILSGKKTFLKYIKSKKFGKNPSYQLVFDPLIYNYLQLGGINQEDISNKTIAPIGIIRFIYFMYVNNIYRDKGYLDKFIKKYIDINIPVILKHTRGIHILRTSTLIPIALIIEKKQLYNYLVYNKDSKLLYKNYKFIKDPLLSEYLQLINLSTENIYLSTLVPLGLLLVLYNLYCV